VESQFRGEGKGTRLLENELVFRAHGDKIFVSDCDPFVVDVFDKKGNLLYSIKRDVETVPVSAEFKPKAQEFFEQTRGIKIFTVISNPLPAPNASRQSRRFLPTITGFTS
jgi:hypothetical protein